MNLYYNNAFDANRAYDGMLQDMQLVFAYDPAGMSICLEPPYIRKI